MTTGATEAATPLPHVKPARSLRDRAMRGTMWTVAGVGASMVLRFGSSLVLTRLLMPEIFGLMAIVSVLFQGLLMFSDVGIGPAIIQNERGDDEPFYNTAWTIQVIRGAMLWLAACVIAFPVAQLYGHGELLWVLPAVAFSALIAGFNSTAVFRLNRHLYVGRITMLELATQVLTMIGTFTWAYFHRSIWALVFPALIGRLCYTIATHLLLGPQQERNRFRWDPEAAQALFRFGRWIFLSTLLTFLANQTDKLIYGKLIPIGLLGIFGVAALYATIPVQLVQKLSSTVIFPAYSRVLEEPGRFAQVFRRVRLPLLLMAGCAIAMLIATGPAFIALLYDPRWISAGWMVQLVAIGAWFQIMEATNGSALLAHGRSHWVAASTGAKFATMLALIPLGFYLGGFAGAVIGAAASEVIRYVISAIGTYRLGVNMVPIDLLVCLGIAATVALTYGLGTLLPQTQWRQMIFLGQSILLIALIWMPAALWLWRRSRTPAPAPA